MDVFVTDRSMGCVLISAPVDQLCLLASAQEGNATQIQNNNYAAMIWSSAVHIKIIQNSCNRDSAEFEVEQSLYGGY